MFRRNVVLFFTLMLLSPAAFAKSKPVADAIEVDTYDNFKLRVVDIRSEMTIGGRYEYLRGMDREAVNQMLDGMAGLLEASGSITAMPADAKSSLIADQQAVNELLARFADNRVICAHEAPIGSLIPKKTCRTLRQIERTRSKSRSGIMDMQKDAATGGE